VVVISHCKEFTDAVCDERWDVAHHTVAVTRRPGAAPVGEKEKTTVSVFLPRNASGRDLALEGDDLDAAILEAERLKAAKREAAKAKKAEKDQAKLLKAARRF
jgi:ATPase subunit of ABC transporter with duplicated ATPase domains